MWMGVSEKVHAKPLGKIGERATTSDVVDKLVVVLGDENGNVRWHACQTLWKMGDKAPTKDVINGLLAALKKIIIGILGRTHAKLLEK